MGKILELKNIFYSIGKRDILEGVNPEIAPGIIHSIIGVNGTGKTTLAGLIMGLEGYRPRKGRIIFNGIDITDYSVTDRARLGITLSWQIPAYFEGVTVYEYLTLGKNDEREIEDAEKYLSSVGLKTEKYMSRVIDESLSGGERKRIELASVLSVHPKVVILDEPDSGIDMASIDAIQSAILSFKREGASVILISHNKEMAGMGDVVSLLCEGTILKTGDANTVSSFFKEYCYDCYSYDDPRCAEKISAIPAYSNATSLEEA